MENRNNESSSYKSIFKSTTIVGGSSIISILIGILKTKIIAVILGPLGIGISTTLSSIPDLVNSYVNMGVPTSAVQRIAACKTSGELSKIVKTSYRITFLSGFIGTVVVILFSRLFSRISFGNTEYAASICLVSILVLITSITSIQNSILQGTHNIKKMALQKILCALPGLIIGIPIYYLFKERGIVAVLLINAFLSMIISLLLLRGIQFDKLYLSIKETFFISKSLLFIGFFIILSTIISSTANYILRSFIVRNGSIELVGLYNSSTIMPNMINNVLLGALLADFLPRLSSVNNDNILVKKYTNEQCEITLLLGGPIFLWCILFAPIIIKSLLSNEFLQATFLIRLLFLNSYIILITWPLGVIFFAKGKTYYSAIFDFISITLSTVLAIVLWSNLGIDGIGLAFCFGSIIKSLIFFFAAKKISDFSYNKYNFFNIFVFSLLIGISFLIINAVNNNIVYCIIACIISLLGMSYTLFFLNKNINLRALFRNRILKNSN